MLNKNGVDALQAEVTHDSQRYVAAPDPVVRAVSQPS